MKFIPLGSHAYLSRDPTLVSTVFVTKNIFTLQNLSRNRSDQFYGGDTYCTPCVCSLPSVFENLGPAWCYVRCLEHRLKLYNFTFFAFSFPLSRIIRTTGLLLALLFKVKQFTMLQIYLKNKTRMGRFQAWSFLEEPRRPLSYGMFETHHSRPDHHRDPLQRCNDGHQDRGLSFSVISSSARLVLHCHKFEIYGVHVAHNTHLFNAFSHSRVSFFTQCYRSGWLDRLYEVIHFCFVCIYRNFGFQQGLLRFLSFILVFECIVLFWVRVGLFIPSFVIFNRFRANSCSKFL